MPGSLWQAPHAAQIETINNIFRPYIEKPDMPLTREEKVTDAVLVTGSLAPRTNNPEEGYLAKAGYPFFFLPVIVRQPVSARMQADPGRMLTCSRRWFPGVWRWLHPPSCLSQGCRFPSGYRYIRRQIQHSQRHRFLHLPELTLSRRRLAYIPWSDPSCTVLPAGCLGMCRDRRVWLFAFHEKL